MSHRSMVEVFDIVKKYHYLYNKGEHEFMCIAAKYAFRDGKITANERDRLISLINDEIKWYADCFIPKENDFEFNEHTSLFLVIVEALKSWYYDKLWVIDRDRFYEMADEIIPSWWDSFYKKLRSMEEV